MASKPRIVVVTTHPFAAADPEPLQLLSAAGHRVVTNPYKRKMTRDELTDFVSSADAIIAGTDRFDEDTLRRADQVRLIARVGVGLDGIGWDAVTSRGISVTYTPDPPAAAVAELALALTLALLRAIPQTHADMRNRLWNRRMGRQLGGRTVGIVGLGRAGRHLAGLLQPFGCRLLAHDIAPDSEFCKQRHVTMVPRETIFSEADVVSLHLSLNSKTARIINTDTLALMKPTAFLVNTARGGLVDNDALLLALSEKRIAGAALDVFEREPYQGPLCELDNVVLTCHVGAYTSSARAAMERQAATEVVRFFRGKPPLCPAKAQAR